MLTGGYLSGEFGSCAVIPLQLSGAALNKEWNLTVRLNLIADRARLIAASMKQQHTEQLTACPDL